MGWTARNIIAYVGVYNKVYILWLQATFSEALCDIRKGRHGLPRLSVFLDRRSISREISPETKIEDDACELLRLQTFMLYEKCQRGNLLPRLLGDWMNELVFWQSEVSR